MDITSDTSHRIVFPQRAVSPPQVFDGSVRLAIDGLSVPYHLTTCFRTDADPQFFHAVAVRSCRLACMAADIVRGRSVPTAVFRVASHSCISRLRTMAMLLEIHEDEQSDVGKDAHSDMKRYPVVPFLVNGMLVSPERFEMCVRLGIGHATYWSSLVFRLVGSRWLCVMADFG